MWRCCCNCASAGGALGAAGAAGGAGQSIADRLITMMSKKISDAASKHDKHGAQSDGCPRQFVEMCSERGSSPLYIAIIFVNYQPLTLAKCPLDWCRERASPRVWCILVSPLSNCDGFRFPEPYWLVLVDILAGTSRGGRECPPHHVGTRSSNAKTMKAKALAHIPCELDRGSKLSKN